MEKRINVLNCPADLYSMPEVLEKASEGLKENKNIQIVTINPEMIMNAQKNPKFLEIINSSDINTIDGVGVKLALKLRKINVDSPRGVDLARALIEYAANNNFSVAFLGAKEEVIQKAKENFLQKYPNLNFVYVRNGYFSDDESIIGEISEKSPKIVLVGLGSPRQEIFISKLKNRLQGAILIGVGGSFDVFSGIVQEAPEIYRRLGLEWLYRTIKQPERFKRIFPTLPIFLIKCIIEIIMKKG